MNEAHPSISTAAAATANRLRAVAADLADAAPTVRRGHMANEIEQALGRIVPGARKEFLKALEEKFPAWDGQVRLGAGDQEPRSQADQRELDDPGFLVNQLCQRSQAPLPEALLERLREAGVIPSNTGLPWSEPSLQALRNKLQLGDQRNLDYERLMELTIQLIDFTLSLHQLVGTAWRTIAPNADVKYRQGSLLSAMGRFVAKDANVNKAQLSSDIEKLRQMVASLVAAIGDVGRQFASSYVSRFAPSEIKSAAMSEPGVFVSMESKCWRKYQEVWDTLDEAAIEREIRDTIAKFAQTLLKGLSH